MTMPVTFPEFDKARGTRSVVVALDAPVVDGVPDGRGGTLSLAALTAVGNALNVSCYLYSGGAVTGSQEKVTATSRVCDDIDRESLGKGKYELTDLSYGHKDQEDDTHESNAARAMLAKGTVVDMIERRGIPSKIEDLKVGDFVSIYKDIELGIQNYAPTSDDDSGEWAINQAGALRGQVYHGVELVA